MSMFYLSAEWGEEPEFPRLSLCQMFARPPMADRAAQAQGKQAENQAGGTAANYGSTAAGIGGIVVPTLERDLNNAPGFSPTQLNNMTVAGEQATGGAASGITGQAGLQAARTRNSGATSGVLDMAMRRKAQQDSANNLGIAGKNAMLEQQQRANALQGLQGMYGTDVGAQLKAMGIQDEDINSEIEAGKSGWLQNAEGVGNTLANIGKGGGSFMSGLAALNQS